MAGSSPAAAPPATYGMPLGLLRDRERGSPGCWCRRTGSAPVRGLVDAAVADPLLCSRRSAYAMVRLPRFVGRILVRIGEPHCEPVIPRLRPETLSETAKHTKSTPPEASRRQKTAISRTGDRKISMKCHSLERVTGIEPALSAWETTFYPLNYTRAEPAVLRRGGATVFARTLVPNR